MNVILITFWKHISLQIFFYIKDQCLPHQIFFLQNKFPYKKWSKDKDMTICIAHIIKLKIMHCDDYLEKFRVKSDRKGL